MTKTKKQINALLSRLRAAYPNVETQLRHRNPFELLIATILSAQCTDRQVNAVTGALFQQLPTPEKMANAPISKIENLIRSTGFYHNKAKHIKACAQALVSTFDGLVPQSLDALITLPGVGRKTANVVLGAAFGTPGIVVDTHVARLSRRIGLTRETDPVKIEFDLMKRLPKSAWSDFCLHLIFHGRLICKARKPDCPDCMLADLCDFAAGKQSTE